MAATTALREALNHGISSGNFVDTKIIVYSYRSSAGRVCRPKALYANSHVLKTVPYFNDSEHSATLDTVFSDAHAIGLKVLFGGFEESQSKNFKEPINVEEYSKDYDYSSDSDLEDEDDGVRLERGDPLKSKAQIRPFTPLVIPGGDDKIICDEHGEHIHKGKVIKIPDVAFVT